LFVRSKAQEAKRTHFMILILQRIIIPFAITSRSKSINNKLQLRKVSHFAEQAKDLIRMRKRRR